MEKFIVPESSFFRILYLSVACCLGSVSCATLSDPADSSVVVTDVPMAIERSLATYRGSYENCKVIQETHVVHFPFVLPVNEPVIKPIDASSDAILIKYRSMRWSDIGITLLGFLFGVISDTAVIAECGELSASDTRPEKTGSSLEDNQQVGVFRFRFETGVGSSATSDAPLAGLKKRIENQSEAHFLVAVSADCEGDEAENKRLMEERANYATDMLSKLGVPRNRTEVLYRNLRQCGEESESRPADRYVYIIVKEGGP